MIEAGSETTSQVLNNCIIGLLSNPGAVKAAQEELDRVVGPDRTPAFSDEMDLPYIRAIVKVCSLSHAILKKRKSFAGGRSTNLDRIISTHKTTGMGIISFPKTPSL
jgi:hypothetical protein